jgi:hypothetical protein
LNGTAWQQVGPSSSTNPAYQQLTGNVVSLLHNGQTAKPSTTLTLPNSIIQLSSLASDPFSPVGKRAFVPLTVDQQQQAGRLQNVGQFAFQNLFLNGDPQQQDSQQLNTTNYSQRSGQENFVDSGLQQNGYPPSGSSARRTRRFSHHSSQNEPTTSGSENAGLLLHHRHKHLPRGAPTLQQVKTYPALSKTF